MSHEMSYMGQKAFNHEQSSNAEEEYERLRNLAKQEGAMRASCFERSRKAYEDGDGALAKKLSEEGKAHGHKMEEFNRQASEFIFRENNANGRVAADAIDLHGQYVEEAEDILEQRIKYAREHGQTHLHVIVGKGNHSVSHIQKLRPRVEQVCREMGLQYTTEENAGRIYVNLTGGPAVPPPEHHSGYSSPHHQQQQQHHGGYSQHPPQQQQQQQQDDVEQLVDTLLPRLIRKLQKACCLVM
ncbi:hypothetical protein Egran_01463 [Elaphomyces granulatus]|uniref:Smr domain-containing protein n=1 Tax=Elaphomyces granulatus TaxID=519963 RepID=A0A232M356_9EURO|nr:hypothetical protein Egran_01463 [Elaphomyces granulatus]